MEATAQVGATPLAAIPLVVIRAVRRPLRAQRVRRKSARGAVSSRYNLQRHDPHFQVWITS